MRRLRRRPAEVAAVTSVAALCVLALAGCGERYATTPVGVGALDPPTSLTYELIPSGNPTVPDGILLRWVAPNDGRVANFVVYSRGSTADAWGRRGETTSNTFHDAGVPHLQYFVASEDAAGDESRGTDAITVDERNRLPAPSALTSISLDSAIQLSWSPNSRTSAPNLFAYYRVYSSPFDLDAGRCDDVHWVLEGSTVSEDFLATGLDDGVPRCFDVSTVSSDGHESAWATPRHDTPRHDARNAIVDALQSAAATSGFKFVDATSATSARFGVVLSGSRADLDFRVERRSDGSLWLTPVRSDVRVALYATSPVADLTSIDVAPARSAFSTGAIEAVPGYAYVFETQLADGLHYAAVRVTHVNANYVIFDWAYQSDPGNPELRRVRGGGAVGGVGGV